MGPKPQSRNELGARGELPPTCGCAFFGPKHAVCMPVGCPGATIARAQIGSAFQKMGSEGMPRWHDSGGEGSGRRSLSSVIRTTLGLCNRGDSRQAPASAKPPQHKKLVRRKLRRSSAFTIAELEEKMARLGRETKAIEIKYQHLPAVATEEKKQKNREFLVVGWNADAALFKELSSSSLGAAS